MNSFWNSLFDNLKLCGRNATFFICVLLVFLGVPVLLAIISETGAGDYVLPALPWMGLVAAAWAAVAIYRAQTRRRERLEHPPLSRDELRVARSKLVKDRNRKGA